MKRDFIIKYCFIFNVSYEKAEEVFLSALKCGDLDFIREIIHTKGVEK